MPMSHTRTDSVAARPRVRSATPLKLTWQFDGVRLTCRWIATPDEESGVPLPLPHVA
jgi:hypothetical protein